VACVLAGVVLCGVVEASTSRQGAGLMMLLRGPGRREVGGGVTMGLVCVFGGGEQGKQLCKRESVKVVPTVYSSRFSLSAPHIILLVPSFSSNDSVTILPAAPLL
jgi:hypothetical protein